MNASEQRGSRRPIYSVHGLPVFQNCTFASRDEARNCPKGDVTLVQDAATGLIFNEAFDPRLMIYGPDYQNEQALSDAFKAHLGEVTRIVDRHFRGRPLIEVGCGKGFFLEWLLDRGFDVVGMDPTYEGTNPRVVKEYFSPASGHRADGIILRHVLEHVQDPVAFLQTIRDANGGAGRIYIEVPCFEWICERRAWFDVFYEHVNYFRLSDFGRIFATVHEAGHLFGGQYLYVVADLASVQTPVAAPSDLVTLPADFIGRVDKHAALVKAMAGHQAVIWGGASKGVIFGLMMERAGAAIDFVVDINPAKQDRYLPATGLEVHSPEEARRSLAPSANIFVMNENYLEEIRALTGNRYNYVPVDELRGPTGAHG